MNIKISGSDELHNDLNNLSAGVERLTEEDTITFEQLFPNSFIQKHTKFASIEELFENGGFTINSEEDFDAIDDKELDKHISATTDFDSWEDMLGEAFDEYAFK